MSQVAEANATEQAVPAPAVTVAIHQPNYFPYLGFFHKLARADVFVILDNVQFNRGGYVNRNRIKTASGVQWLTVPVAKKGKCFAPITDIRPAWDQPWAAKHLASLKTAYNRSPFFTEVMDLVVSPVLADAQRTRCSLPELGSAGIRAVCSYLGIDVPLHLASDCDASDHPTLRLVHLTRAMGGDRYLAGRTGASYMEADLFAEHGVSLAFDSFEHPTYAQRFGTFVPNLSVLDALFNCGRYTRELVETVDTVRTAIH